MPAKKGSDLIVELGSTTLISGRSKTVTVNNSAVDVTTDGDTDASDQHWEVILPTVKSFSAQVVGVANAHTDYNALQAYAMGNPIAASSTITFANGATLEGDLLVESFEEGGEVSGEVTFSITLRAAGVLTYTAPGA